MSVLNLTASNFDDEVAAGKVLVDFWAGWCEPCRMLAPTIDAVAADAGERAKIAKVDIVQESALAARYKVMSIPTVILFENGTEIKRFVGVQSKETYLSEL